MNQDLDRNLIADTTNTVDFSTIGALPAQQTRMCTNTSIGGSTLDIYHPQNQERALNLSILIVSGPGEFPRVESN